VAYYYRGSAYKAKGIYSRMLTDYIKILQNEFKVEFIADKSKLGNAWFGVALYSEIQISRFLGDTTAAARYDGWLKDICDLNKISRAEIETLYRNNIGAPIGDIIDEQFNKIKFQLDGTYNAVLTRFLSPQCCQHYRLYRMFAVFGLVPGSA
jgi:hypothetical protein